MYPLKNLEYDADNQRVFIVSGSGQLYIFTLTEKPPKLVKDVETGSKGILRDLCIDHVRNYIFTCNSTKECRWDGWNDIGTRNWQTRKR